MPNPFVDHPQSVGESYAEHCVMATGFGMRMIVGGIACMIHGLLPFCFERTGSTIIRSLHDRMIAKRQRHIGTVAAE